LIDRVIAWWNRPLEDPERRRMFVLAAIALVALAVLLIARQQAGPETRPAAAPASPPPEAQPRTRAAPQEVAQPDKRSADDERQGSEREERYDPTPADVTAAKRGARRFLTDYLPYTYGRGEAEEIRSAAPALRAELARQPPRVPPTVTRRARPRVTTLQAETAERDWASVLALVADGRRRYTITLGLEREASEWRVADISG
jgi:hypothetical protein